MKIAQVATNVVSIWEHGGQYTCHGNGAYGLIGFQFGNVTSLLQAFLKAGGAIQHKVGWYADELIRRAKTGKTHKDKIIPELDQLAHNQLMQKIQRIMAEDYMIKAIKEQKQYYDFKMPLSQLILCDMGVNNGIWNKYVQDVAVKHPDDEFGVIWEAQRIRIKAMKEHGFWSKYAGIRNRYNYYLGLCKGNHHLTMKKYCPVLEVNGYNVNIGEYPIECV